MTGSHPMSGKDLLRLRKAESDELFKQLQSGALPIGDGLGSAIAFGGTWLAKPLFWFARVFLWQGKVVTAFPNCQAMTLVNKITPFGIRAIAARVYYDTSWLDGKECIHIDYSMTSLLARPIRDEIREISPGFYLGKVWWGKTRLLDFSLEFAEMKQAETRLESGAMGAGEPGAKEAAQA